MLHARASLFSAFLLAACVVAQAQPPPATGGAFELIDQNGHTFSSASLLGRPYALFFGFTHCPDICPTTLLQMSNHLAALGADADRLTVVFVSVDPEQDTPAVIKDYLGSFDPRIVGLTGTPEQVAAAAKGWNAFYNRIAEGDGRYTIVHSAYVYLVDGANRLTGTLGFNEPEADQRAKLQALLARP